jgi:hypothetical protein
MKRLNIVLHEIVGFREGLSARLGVLAVGEGIPQREHAAPGAIARVEHRDLVSRLDQFVRRGESGQPRTRDEDFFGGPAGPSNGKRSGGNQRSSEKIAPAGISARHD